MPRTNLKDHVLETLADVTVVIPFFNSSTTLRRALTSVQSQTRPPRETIVVDDASTPDEHDAASRLVRATPRSRLITLSSNRGAGEARNAGWNASKSAWVAFLDSDDVWHPRKLEFQLDAASSSEQESVLIACQLRRTSDNVDFSGNEIPEMPSVRTITKRDLLIRNQFSTPTVMVRRDMSTRFPQGRRYCEDYELWLLIAGSQKPLVRVEAPLAAMFKDAYGASGLSAHIAQMITGEFQALVGAYRAGAISLAELLVALTICVGRTSRRLLILGVRRVRGNRE